MVWMGVGYNYIDTPVNVNSREEQKRKRLQGLLSTQNKEM